MPTFRRDDDLFGSMTVEIPDGYRPLGTLEMARRERACSAADDWTDLAVATLYDPSTRQHLPISAMPYRWRVFVERKVT